MLTVFKKLGAAGFVALGILGTLLTTNLELVSNYFTEEALEEREEKSQTVEFDKFIETSKILDHKIENGKVYFKYKTCNPPSTGDYHYRVVINGKPSEEYPKQGWFNINDWFAPAQCTQGWWGRNGWELEENLRYPIDVRIVWQWRVLVNDRDQPTYNTVMQYVIPR